MAKWLALFVSLTLGWTLACAGLAAAAGMDQSAGEGHTIGSYGGTFKVAVLGDPGTFNPLAAVDPTSVAVSRILFDSLTKIDGVSQEVAPALVERWEASEDGLTWTLHLRRGVYWHDGEPFAADDVLFTFDLILDDSVQKSDLLILDARPFEVRQIDAHTVELNLATPFAPLVRALSIPVLPRHLLEEAWAAGAINEAWGSGAPLQGIVGTGAFRMAAYEPQDRIVLERNHHYWKFDAADQRLPYLDRVELIVVSDRSEQRSQFERGETDFMLIEPSEHAAALNMAIQGDYVLYEGGPKFSSEFIVFNQNMASRPVHDWFSIKAFRQAVAHALDKRAMIDQIYDGRASAQWSPVSSENKAFYNPHVRQYPFDLTRAEELLGEAGFFQGADGRLRDGKGNIVRFTLTTNVDNAERVAAASLIAASLGRLGIEATIETLEFERVVKRLLSGDGWDVVAIGLAGVLDPHEARRVWRSSGELHIWRSNDEQPIAEWEARIDEILEAGASALDQDERRRLYDEWQAIAAEELPFVYTVVPNMAAAVRITVQNVAFTAYGGMLHNVEELWKAEN